MTEDPMRESVSALNRLIAGLAARGIQRGISAHEGGWRVWIGEDPEHPVAAGYVERFSGIVPWLEAQAKQHYGIEGRAHG